MMKGMMQNVLYPLIRRGGTALSVYLVSLGVSHTHAEDVALGAISFGLIAVDLGLSYMNRKD